jgi:hypothetical protein
MTYEHHCIRILLLEAEVLVDCSSTTFRNNYMHNEGSSNSTGYSTPIYMPVSENESIEIAARKPENT